MKIVDKRNQLYEDLNQIDDNQIIDRYKFLNIYPCTLNELKLLGYNENIIAGGSLSNANGSSNGITSGSGAGGSGGSSGVTGGGSNSSNNNLIISNTNDETINKVNSEKFDSNAFNPFSKLCSRKLTRYPVPDVNKMFPFKPNRNAFSGLQPVAGGGLFLFPSCIAEMIKRLPAPSSFDVLIYFVIFKKRSYVFGVSKLIRFLPKS